MRIVIIAFVLIFLLSCNNCKTNDENTTDHYSYEKKYIDQDGGFNYESKLEYIDNDGVHHQQNKSRYYKESLEYDDDDGEKYNKRTYKSESQTEHYEFKK